MTESDSLKAMEHFPHPATLPDQFTRDTAIAAIWRVAEATRGALDEIAKRTPVDVLNDTEVVTINQLAEQFSTEAASLYTQLLTKD